jgi:hypothetical protein
VWTALLAVALISCDLLPKTTKAPTGPLGDVLRNAAALLAPNADVKDPRFEQFLAGLDLKGAFGDQSSQILDQIREGRTKTRPSATQASTGRLASVRPVLGESIVIDFAKTLASVLDEMTKASGTHQFPELKPTSHTSEDSDNVTTSSTAETSSATSTGSRVTLTVVWSYREKTTSKKTGEVVLEISEDRAMVGAITVCPDFQGAVGATLDVKGEFKGLIKGRSMTVGQSSGSVFTGYTNDSATLTNVHHVIQDKQNWSDATGDGSYDMTLAMTSGADASGSFSQGGDLSSGTGDITFNGVAALQRAINGAALSFALNAHSLDEAYQAAQRLWRNGRCVMVTAPDYSAQTPLEVNDQNKSQNDKAVDRASETKFAVALKHRFEGAVPSAPVTASLSGQKTLEPNNLESGSGSLNYKAPDEDDKKATATLKTTSKRGIGTLVLDFHTAKEGLILTISGTLKLERRFIGTSTEVTDTVSIGPVEFKKTFDNFWEGTGAWTAQTRSVASVPGSTQTCTGSQRGTITMLATVEVRGGKKVWVVEPLDAEANGTATSSCQGEINVDADAAELFLGSFQTWVIPEEGRTFAIHGESGNPALGAATADGTVKATTKN